MCERHLWPLQTSKSKNMSRAQWHQGISTTGGTPLNKCEDGKP